MINKSNILNPNKITITINSGSQHFPAKEKAIEQWNSINEAIEIIIKHIPNDYSNEEILGLLYRFSGTLHKYIKDGGWDYQEPRAHIHLQGDYYEKIIFDHYHRWFTKNPDISITCALEPLCKEEILGYMSEGKFDTSKLPIEIWPVSKAEEAFKYKAEKGDDVFKIVFDWSK